jgi:hypothetical protein
VLLLACVACAFASDKKDKKKQPETKVVDSGSFAVFVSGRRVATEIFTVKQLADMSVTTSDIKLEGSNQSQHSELQLTPRGDLIRYDWKENGTSEKGETSVAPTDQFLVQRVKANDKYTEQPYLMPSSSAILDDYFISHRELLLWRYIGAGCVPEQGKQGCTLATAKFGFVVPRQRSSGMATLNYIGRETVDLHGAVKELSKFSLSSEFGDWVLYLDENHKLVRVLVLGEGTEIIRD